MVSGENGQRISRELKIARKRCRFNQSTTEIWIDVSGIHLVGDPSVEQSTERKAINCINYIIITFSAKICERFSENICELKMLNTREFCYMAHTGTNCQAW